MQIELIETFLDLMETNSFNRTAERLGVTQSTVSSRVIALEQLLGKKLFLRSRAGTRPTLAGQRMLDHARSLRHQWNEARRSVQSAGDFTQSMRIGIQHDLGATRMGDWMAGFRSALPGTSFYVELDYSNQMSADLLSGELDFAVLYTPRQNPDLHYERIGEVSYVMISSDARSIADVSAGSYVFANYSPAFDRIHRQIAGHLSAAHFASGQNMAVCGLLNEIGGSAYVLSEHAHSMSASGKFNVIGDAPVIAQTAFAAMHLSHRHSRAHQKLLDVVRKRFPAVASSG